MDEIQPLQWFVLRDLKRSNAKQPAYRLLEGMGIEVFTPMVWKILVRNGKRVREEVPFMRDLLFAHDTHATLDPIVERTDTLQYRYVRGGYKVPMTVREADMRRFVHAVRSSENPKSRRGTSVCASSPGFSQASIMSLLVTLIVDVDVP